MVFLILFKLFLVFFYIDGKFGMQFRVRLKHRFKCNICDKLNIDYYKCVLELCFECFLFYLLCSNCFDSTSFNLDFFFIHRLDFACCNWVHPRSHISFVRNAKLFVASLLHCRLHCWWCYHVFQLGCKTDSCLKLVTAVDIQLSCRSCDDLKQLAAS